MAVLRGFKSFALQAKSFGLQCKTFTVAGKSFTGDCSGDMGGVFLLQ